MLKLKDINVVFLKNTTNEKKALQDLSLDIKEGDFITIIGSNGAGKSTLLNTISGSIEINRGSILLDGVEQSSKKEHERARCIGRLFQDPLKGTAPSMTIEENLELSYRRGKENETFFQKFLKAGISKEIKEMFKERLKSIDLGLEDRMHDRVGLLSGGQRQALTLLMATMNTPKLLLLDEHTAALDPKTAKKIMEVTDQIIQEKKITTIMITHNIEQALQYGNRMIVLSQGKIVFDFDEQTKKNLTTNEVIEMYSKTNAKELSDSMLLS